MSRALLRVAALGCVEAALTVALLGCGARTGLELDDAGPPCMSDDVCDDGRVCNGREICREGRCVPGAPLVCDDRDECTIDACDEPTGCAHTVLRHDRDGDHVDGADPGAPLGCSPDCDDSDPRVFPGATETCNGIDDDCDAHIDEGAAYMPALRETRVTMDDTASSPGSVIWIPETSTWGAAYWDYGSGSADITYLQIDADGAGLGDRVLLTPQPGDAFGAELLWDGNDVAVAWEDRRAGNFEVYFNRLSPDGVKIAPDTRVTDAPSFSINLAIAAAPDRYVLVWQDARDDEMLEQNFEIYMTLLDRDGLELGDDVRLTFDDYPDESPAIALSPTRVGIAYLSAETGVPLVSFMQTTLDGDRIGTPRLLSPDASRVLGASIARVDDAFIVAWSEVPVGRDEPDIVAVRVRDDGVVEPVVRVVEGPQWSRGVSMMSNGDRVVLVYGDDRGGSYDLYMRLFDASLTPIGTEQQVTTATADSIAPTLGRGTTSLGVLFKDQRDGNWEVYFTRLMCAE